MPAFSLALSHIASTVYRIVNTFQTTGTVMKKLYSCENQLTVLMHKPGIYLWEIQYELSWMFGLSIHHFSEEE